MKQYFICLIISSCVLTSTAQNIEPFNWMVGSWKIEGSRGTNLESWTRLNDSTLQGNSMMVKNLKDTILQETLELAFREGDWYYISTVQGQNNNQPVRFRIIFQKNGEFISENREHDFPQRISYRKLNHQLYASIEGWRKGKFNKVNFDFTPDY